MKEIEKKLSSAADRKEKIKKRYSVDNSGNVTILPGKEVVNIYDDSSFKRVGVYARVSTGNEEQTSSYQLQSEYYEKMVNERKNWELVDVYADEGISGTSLNHRESFKRMIKDCEAGLIDLIVTKNVPRFARNIVDCITISRELKALKPPVGILFETEGIYTLNENSEMQLSFLATLAQEESHVKSQSMNRSYRMRFERGMFLTPVLLGYDHDEEGNLIINKDEAKTVRLIFLLYMCGKTCREIADVLTELERVTKAGNTIWQDGSIYGILKNERYCGDVLAQKTFTPDFLDHKSVKVRDGERPQYYSKDHHEAIVSREEFITVQKMMDQSKYGFRKAIPELNVINSGVLKGFVQINPYWMGFTENDYLDACHSVLTDADYLNPIITIKRFKGDLNLENCQVSRGQYLSSTYKISVNISYKRIRFSAKAVESMDNKTRVEMLYHPLYSLLVVRIAQKGEKHSVKWATYDGNKYRPNHLRGNSFCPMLYTLNEWNPEFSYTLSGYIKEQNGQKILLFYADEPEIRIREGEKEKIALKAEWQHGFGDYYNQYIAKSESVFTSGEVWDINNPGVVANIPEYKVPKDRFEKQINKLMSELTKDKAERNIKNGEL